MAKKPSKKKPVTRTAKTPPPHTEEVYDGSTPLPDPHQELFCVLYTSNTTPRFFGNGTESYGFAYGYHERINEINELLQGPAKNRKGQSKNKLLADIRKMKSTASTCGARLLINARVKARCDALFDAMFTEEIMDRELVYVIQQRKDLQSKVRAWEMAAKLKQRIKEKAEITHVFEPVKGFTYVTPEDLPKK